MQLRHPEVEVYGNVAVVTGYTVGTITSPDGTARPIANRRTVEVLFEGGYFLGRRPNYDVGPYRRFLMIKNEEPEVGQIIVVLNWFEELKRLVPTP